jgi:ribosomal protein S18 acetylase RimI-like enzyme
MMAELTPALSGPPMNSIRRRPTRSPRTPGAEEHVAVDNPHALALPRGTGRYGDLVSETTLRPAVPADLPVIFRAERDYIKAIEPDQEGEWTAAIDRNLDLWIANLDRTTMLLAGTDIAGFVIWTPTPEYRDDAATLITIQVRPAYRRRGYGRILLGVFAEQAVAAGCRLLHLGVHKDNPARALYEQAGYQPAGSDGDYLSYDTDAV